MSKIDDFINSFPEADRSTLELINASIRIVNLSQLQDDLMEALAEHIEKNVKPSRGFIIDPVIGFDDLQKWHRLNFSRFQPGQLPQDASKIKYYFHADPSTIFHDSSGSEHFSAVVRREIRSKIKLKFRKNVLDKPDRRSGMNNLNFIFVVDNTASGTQIIKFVDQIILGIDAIDPRPQFNPLTIEITVITWGATRQAIQAINDKYKTLPEGLKFELKYLNYIQTCSDFSDEQVSDSIQRVVRTHRIKGKHSHFSDIASLTVFEGHSCPNNLPNFYFRNRGKSKLALFENRFVASEITKELSRKYEYFDKPEFRDIHGARFRANGLYRVWKLTNLLEDHFHKYLCYIAVRDSAQVAVALLECSYSKKREIIGECLRLGYVDEKFELQSRGMNALRAFERANRRLLHESTWQNKKPAVDRQRIIYYPTSIDGVAVIPGNA